MFAGACATLAALCKDNYTSQSKCHNCHAVLKLVSAAHKLQEEVSTTAYKKFSDACETLFAAIWSIVEGHEDNLRLALKYGTFSLGVAFIFC